MLAEPMSPGRDEDEALELLRAVFRPGRPDRYADEYPIALARENLAFRRVVRSGGRIVSHAAGLHSIQRAGPVEFRLGFIGSVATDPAFRGRGGAGEALRATETSLADAGAVIAALWSGPDEARFYESRGYAAAGREIRLTLPPAGDAGERALVTRLRPDDLPAVRALHAGEPSLTLRSAEDEERLFAVPGTHGFALREGGGALSAYAVVGRGADFPFHVHEWGGKDAAVETLVRGVAALHRGRSITVLAPAFRAGLVARLVLAGAALEEHPLGLFKILRPDDLVSLANGVFESAGAPHRASREGSWVRVAPESGGGPALRLAEPEWLRAVIGPDGRGLPALPLPFFVWGMDSI